MTPIRSPLSSVIPQLIALSGLLLLCNAEAQTLLTVKEAEFRSRWAGPQEDRELTPQYFQPDGGLYEDETG